MKQCVAVIEAGGFELEALEGAAAVDKRGLRGAQQTDVLELGLVKVV